MTILYEECDICRKLDNVEKKKYKHYSDEIEEGWICDNCEKKFANSEVDGE